MYEFEDAGYAEILIKKNTHTQVERSSSFNRYVVTHGIKKQLFLVMSLYVSMYYITSCQRIAKFKKEKKGKERTLFFHC